MRSARRAARHHAHRPHRPGLERGRGPRGPRLHPRPAGGGPASTTAGPGARPLPRRRRRGAGGWRCCSGPTWWSASAWPAWPCCGGAGGATSCARWPSGCSSASRPIAGAPGHGRVRAPSFEGMFLAARVRAAGRAPPADPAVVGPPRRRPRGGRPAAGAGLAAPDARRVAAGHAVVLRPARCRRWSSSGTGVVAVRREPTRARARVLLVVGAARPRPAAAGPPAPRHHPPGVGVVRVDGVPAGGLCAVGRVGGGAAGPDCRRRRSVPRPRPCSRCCWWSWCCPPTRPGRGPT